MKRSLITLTLCLAASAVAAQPKPFTPAMSCGRSNSLVAANGAVVLATGPTTYDRYVSGANFCAVGEMIEAAWVPSADTPQCFVGYRCRDRYRFR